MIGIDMGKPAAIPPAPAVRLDLIGITGIRTKSSWVVNLLDFVEEIKLTPKEKLLVDFIGERNNVPLDEIQAEFSGNYLIKLKNRSEKLTLSRKYFREFKERI